MNISAKQPHGISVARALKKLIKNAIRVCINYMCQPRVTIYLAKYTNGVFNWKYRREQVALSLLGGRIVFGIPCQALLALIALPPLFIVNRQMSE